MLVLKSQSLTELKLDGTDIVASDVSGGNLERYPIAALKYNESQITEGVPYHSIYSKDQNRC